MNDSIDLHGPVCQLRGIDSAPLKTHQTLQLTQLRRACGNVLYTSCFVRSFLDLCYKL